MRHVIAFIVPVALLVLGAPTAPAQWYAGLAVGADRFWGASIDNQDRSFRPYRPTTVGIELERRSAKFGLGMRLQYADAALALEGSDAVAAVKGVFGIYGIAPTLAYRLTTLGSNQVRLRVGPLIEIWTVESEDTRIRVGAQGALSLEIPIGGRFAGSLDAGAALTRSPFNEGELTQEYELRVMWRRHFGAGLKYRL